MSAETCQCHSCELLPELHEQVAQMCEFLGSKREEAPCDSWHLRDLIVRLKAQLADTEQAGREAERAEVGKLLSSRLWTAGTCRSTATTLGVGAIHGEQARAQSSCPACGFSRWLEVKP